MYIKNNMTPSKTETLKNKKVVGEDE